MRLEFYFISKVIKSQTKNHRKAMAKKSNLIWTVNYRLGLFSSFFNGILSK